MTGFVVGLLDAFLTFDPVHHERNSALRCNKFHG
jgi:hypothetical protein